MEKANEMISRSYNDSIVIGGENRRVYGCAVRFNSESVDMGFIETINPRAITQETIERSDVFATIDHDKGKILARCNHGKGSLTLELKEDGLYYEFVAPNTALGDEVLEHLKRNEFGGSSFCFSLKQDGTDDRWFRDDNNVLHREILHIDALHDVSCVYSPAYKSTTCDLRAAQVMEKSEIINKSMDSFLKELDIYKI